LRVVFGDDITFENGAILEFNGVSMGKKDDADNKKDAVEENLTPPSRSAHLIEPHARPKSF
jgi:hypothetical protein